ncbi:MAG: hypothetical protein V1694_09635 [Candidatus Eisenbacteria bacterium]
MTGTQLGTILAYGLVASNEGTESAVASDEKSLVRKTRADHILAICKATVSAVPWVGGPIANLIDDYIPSATEKAFRKAFDDLGRRLRELNDRIDVELIDKDEFAEIFKSFVVIVGRTQKESKLRASAALVANTLLKPNDPDKLTYTELDHFARCLEILSIGAIDALGHAVAVAERDGMKNLDRSPYRIDFGRLQQEMKHTDPHLLMGLVGELNSMNLMHLRSLPVAATENYGNYPLHLTPLGTRFVRYLLRG